MRHEIALLRDVVERLDTWLDARTDMTSPAFIEAERELVRAGWAYRAARVDAHRRLTHRG